MEIVSDEQALQAVFGCHLDIGIDNDGLELPTVDLLERFVNDEPNICLPEEAIPAVAYSPHGRPQASMGSHTFKVDHIHLQNSGMQHQQHHPPTTMYGGCSRQPPNGISYVDNQHLMHPTLPDSPPDSEPYSPPDGHHHNHINHNHINHNHIHNHQDSKYPIANTANSMHQSMYPSHHRPPGLPPGLQANKGIPGYNEPPVLNHLPTSQHQPPTSMSHQPPSMNPQILSPSNLSPNINQQNKKRKYPESPNNTVPGAMMRNGILIKQEPPGSSFASYLTDCGDDDLSFDPDSSSGFVDGTYQVIKWQAHETSKWAILTDADLKDLPSPHYRVDADKGFNFSVSDDAFVCQKKNHFQVTVHCGMTGDPKYIRTREGVKKIDYFFVSFNGIKSESPNQTIKVEQSQSDRSKKPFQPARVEVIPDQVTKVTIGRLHFSETTTNNMRKKGRPNPDQRYFKLVVSMNAQCGNGNGNESYLVAASSSERIIVRASNPGQFDSDVDVLWQKGHTQDSVFHIGRVGVNTDHPDEAITVHGNIKVTGHVLQPSDIRAKENFREMDSKEQLKKITQLPIYRYRWSEDFAATIGLPDDQRSETGVIAQEVRDVLPDAVRETGDVLLHSGGTIPNLLVVNKERIFMENVGAVKELCKLTDNLEVRIDELEKMNKRLSKLKRYDSLKSTASSKSTCSASTITSASAYAKKSHSHHHRPNHKTSSSALCSSTGTRSNTNWCSNRFIQITIILLIAIMAFCLIAITVLYILERQKPETTPTPSPVLQDPDHTHQPNVKNTTLVTPNPSTTVSKSTGSPRSATTSPIVPVNYPTIPPYPRPVCTANVCERKCCPPPLDDQIDVHINDGSFNYRVPDNDINNNSTVHVSGESNGLPGSGQTIKPETNEVSNIPNQSDEDPIVVINDGSGAAIDQDTRVINYRVKRRDTGDSHQATIVLKELNYTLGPSLCASDQSCGNYNYTYHLHLSPYFGYEPITVQFRLSNPLIMVHLCHQLNSRWCLSSQPADGDEQREISPTEWKIAVGKSFESKYKFRVTAHLDKQQVCSMPAGENNGTTFTEYNLHFLRTC